MNIASLIENCKAKNRPDLKAEFGLSLHVELQGTRVLFDTGSSGAFVLNARQMGIDLSAVDLAVLSHHHFDHGGGLAVFLGHNASQLSSFNDPAARQVLQGGLQVRVGCARAIQNRCLAVGSEVERRG